VKIYEWWKKTVLSAAPRLFPGLLTAVYRLATFMAASILVVSIVAAATLTYATLAYAAAPTYAASMPGAAPAQASVNAAGGWNAAASREGSDQAIRLDPWLKRVAGTAPCFYLHTFPEPLSEAMIEYGQRAECLNQAPKGGMDGTSAKNGQPEPADGSAKKDGRAEVTAEAAGFQWIHYTVNKGDTLYSIARQFQVSLDAIIMANRIEDPNYIRVGQTLRIPAILPDGPASSLASVPADRSGAANATAAPYTQIGALNVSKVLNATLTAYTAGYESTGKRPGDPAYGITYSGTRVKEGRTIAVDPEVIPLGSQVYIEGLGIRTAEDIGSAIKGNRIDVYMDDVEEALEFGVKKNVKVYVLQSK